jgi:L-ornithine N5-oxygenase
LMVDTTRVVHASSFLRFISGGNLPSDARVAIVGAGQSAGEVVRYLLQRNDVTQISVVGHRHLFTQTDDNPFVNDLYTYPRSLDFLRLSEGEQMRLLADLRNTNFSAISKDVLREIYNLTFADRVRGRDRLRLFSYGEITSVDSTSSGLRLMIKSRDVPSPPITLEVDLLVCATGFRNTRHLALLNSVQPKTEDRDVSVSDCFEVMLGVAGSQRSVPCGPRIFLMNHSPESRGPTENTLAGLAERAALVGDALQSGRRGLMNNRTPISVRGALRHDSVIQPEEQ